MTHEQKLALQYMREKNIGAIWVNGQWVFPEDIRNDPALAVSCARVAK